jgi:tripartite-type tricarboxylate transporter receptor subunit TctC
MKYPWRRLLGLAWLILGVAQSTSGQDFPSKPLRLIVPFPAGGGSDIVGRILAQKLGELSGRQVVVDNRAGAGGSIGTEAAVKSAPDGYTILLASTSEIAVNPSIYKLTYDPAKDLIPVALVASTPMVIVTATSLPVKNVTDLVKYARAKPGDVNVGSAGNGSFTHLAAEYFRSMNGLSWTHVPYKGAPPALTDLAGGRIQVMFSTLPAAMGMIKSNMIKPIAVSAQSRDGNLPEVPTVSESGIEGYDVQYWYGIFVPAGTSRDIVAKLVDTIAQTLKAPDVIDRLAKQGASPGALTQAQFADYVNAEVDKWAKVVKESGARID